MTYKIWSMPFVQEYFVKFKSLNLNCQTEHNFLLTSSAVFGEGGHFISLNVGENLSHSFLTSMVLQ